MGLDQKLIKKIYVGGKYADNSDETFVVKKGDEFLEFKIKDLDVVATDVITWRKNYALNDWFLKRVNSDSEPDNCKDFHVPSGTLIDLYDLLRQLLSLKSKKKRLDFLRKNFPSFDLEDYYDAYIEEFERTYKEIDKITSAPDFTYVDFYYWIWY